VIIERKLQVMGAELVAPSAPLANFIPVQRSGNVLYVAGHLPRKSNGDIAFLGKVGGGVTVEQGYDAAKLAAVNCLASIKDVIGDLDRVKQVLKLLVMVNAVPEFDRHFVVANGASDLLVELYGDAGRHARSAVGMGSLPRGSCVEVEMVVEVAD
jgi:enamine deaminase RidA (YjgF/YER057c/UK114 family)